MNLSQLKDKEFSILLFTAIGCKYCEEAKPNFKEAAERNEAIGFLEADFVENKEYYLKYAELNEEGEPKILIPSFYVHHREAINEENPYGFIGGWEGASKQDLDSVCVMINGFNSNVEVQASI